MLPVSRRTLRADSVARRVAARKAPKSVEVKPVAAVSVRVHRPAPGEGPLPALLWIHGGGYVMGTAAQDDAVCRRFAQDLGIIVAAVDYRLAPEHPFPVPLHDCHDALVWLAQPTRCRCDPHRRRRGKCRRRTRRCLGAARTPTRGRAARLSAPDLPDARRPHGDPPRRRREQLQIVEQQGEPFRLAVLFGPAPGDGRGRRPRRTGTLRRPEPGTSGLDRRGNAGPLL